MAPYAHYAFKQSDPEGRDTRAFRKGLVFWVFRLLNGKHDDVYTLNVRKDDAACKQPSSEDATIRHPVTLFLRLYGGPLSFAGKRV